MKCESVETGEGSEGVDPKGSPKKGRWNEPLVEGARVVEIEDSQPRS